MRKWPGDRAVRPCGARRPCARGEGGQSHLVRKAHQDLLPRLARLSACQLTRPWLTDVQRACVHHGIPQRGSHRCGTKCDKWSCSLTHTSPGLGAAFFALDKLHKSPKETRELNVLTAVGGLVDAGACPPPGERPARPVVHGHAVGAASPRTTAHLSLTSPLNAPPALAQFSKSEYGMDETQANIATVLSGGIGLFAAVKAAEGYGAFGESKSAGV